MDNTRTDGLKHEVKGSIKEATGKVTGDRSQQLEGNVEKNAGRIERNLGEAKDNLRDATDDSRR